MSVEKVPGLQHSVLPGGEEQRHSDGAPATAGQSRNSSAFIREIFLSRGRLEVPDEVPVVPYKERIYYRHPCDQDIVGSFCVFMA